MPFGICSAPEVWQRTMHEFVEDLEGVEVIADDFLIARFGSTDQLVNNSFERHEHAFLEMAELLRHLQDKNVEFQWLPQHSLAMTTIKKFLTEAPVLRYYDVA